MNNLERVIQFVIERYTLATLPELCLALSVRDDDLGGDQISSKSRALVMGMGQEGRFADLLTVLERRWPAAFRQAGFSQDEAFVATLSQEWGSLSRVRQQQMEQISRPWQLLPRPKAFTGREQELEKLMADLQPGRVVALCGPGGIGKTALMSEALHCLNESGELAARFPDGIITTTMSH